MTIAYIDLDRFIALEQRLGGQTELQDTKL